MTSRQRNRTSMTIGSKWAKASALLMAASLFLRAVYYFGFTNFADIGFLEVLFCALIPLILSSVYVVFLYGIHRNAPGTYGLIGGIFCVLLIIWSFYTGSFIRVILSAAWYVIAAGVLLLSTGGSLQNKSLCIAVFAIPVVVRFFVFDIGRLGIFESVAEGAVLFLLASLACLPMTLKYPQRQGRASRKGSTN